MGLPQFVTVELINIECWCGTPFAAPREMYTAVREERGDLTALYCPRGHTVTWRKSEVTRLREQLAEKERSLAWERNRAATAEKRTQVIRGQLTKVQNRIKRGVCPQCNRHFTNVERHMASKHPEAPQKAAE